jgi:molybdopterin molybdotransferase
VAQADQEPARERSPEDGLEHEHPQGSDGHGHDHGSQEMRTVDDVRRWILSKIETLAPIALPLQEAWGCVLAGDVHAEGDLPPFSSSAMDGFAVRAADVEQASMEQPVELRVVGEAFAGRPAATTVGGGEAIRIATGAPVPAGADAVVQVELSVASPDAVSILRAVPEGTNVRPAGQDAKDGSLLIPAGRRISAAELGLLAASGRSSALVYPRARVVVLSTGDELVEPGRAAGFGQIRDSNSFTLFGALRDVGASAYLGGIVRDDADALKEEVLGLSGRADCFISSGGVSVGEKDVVKMAFFRRGEIDFYRVAMQPGMPQAFGLVDDTPYFGLPGNPVSVFVSFEVFIRPALLKMMGRRDIFRPEIWAVLDSEVTGPRDRMTFARVRVWREHGQWKATSTGPSGSNLLSTVSRANGLAVVPVGQDRAMPGDRVRVMLFRALEEEP